jgi:hypothetical protein
VHSSSLVTTLLGRRVRLHKPPPGARSEDGEIVTVYLDGQGMHYVVLVSGQLLQVESSAGFTVLREPDW